LDREKDGSMSMNRAIIPDVSVWNGEVDFVKMKAAGASGVLIRASWLYEDTRFREHREQAKAAGLPYGFYHYLDWRGLVPAQVDLFIKLLGNDPGQIPPVLDLEMDPTPYNMQSAVSLTTGEVQDMLPVTRPLIGKKRSYRNTSRYMLAPNEVQAKAWCWLTAVQKAIRTPSIYTGYFYWRQWMTPDAGWKPFPLHLAWYAAEAAIKTPAPWDQWTKWQFTGNGNGPQWGSAGLSMDLSYFNGTADDFTAWIGAPAPAYRVCPMCNGTGKVLA
jgi:GH25 family lysozyme M1 (1,4-beta-N-acetylmuramidase)